jgi:phosphoglucomutase
MVHAKELFDLMFSDAAPDFGAASDGDGDRNLIVGKHRFVTPSDSLAMLAANAHRAPGYAGAGRDRPLDADQCRRRPRGRLARHSRLRNADRLEVLRQPARRRDGDDLRRGKRGTGSDHVREKDGLWAVLLWLNILAVRKISVDALAREHWAKFGRNYYARHDYEACPPSRPMR